MYDFCGYQYYGGKYLENILTAFIQLRWFPEKFHVDKRRWHLSSMILSGQLSREEAMKELDKPMYNSPLMAEYETFIEKMGLPHGELENLIKAPAHQHSEYRI